MLPARSSASASFPVSAPAERPPVLFARAEDGVVPWAWWGCRQGSAGESFANQAAFLRIAAAVLVHVAWRVDRRRVARRRAGLVGSLVLWFIGRIPRPVRRVAWMGRSVMFAESPGGRRWLLVGTGMHGEFLISRHCLWRKGQGGELIRTRGGCRVQVRPPENLWRALPHGCRRSEQIVCIVSSAFGAEHIVGQGELSGTALRRLPFTGSGACCARGGSGGFHLCGRFAAIGAGGRRVTRFRGA
jgi:hypothetical protein